MVITENTHPTADETRKIIESRHLSYLVESRVRPVHRGDAPENASSCLPAVASFEAIAARRRRYRRRCRGDGDGGPKFHATGISRRNCN